MANFVSISRWAGPIDRRSTISMKFSIQFIRSIRSASFSNRTSLLSFRFVQSSKFIPTDRILFILFCFFLLFQFFVCSFILIYYSFLLYSIVFYFFFNWVLFEISILFSSKKNLQNFIENSGQLIYDKSFGKWNFYIWFVDVWGDGTQMGALTSEPCGIAIEVSLFDWNSWKTKEKLK